MGLNNVVVHFQFLGLTFAKNVDSGFYFVDRVESVSLVFGCGNESDTANTDWVL